MFVNAMVLDISLLLATNIKNFGVHPSINPAMLTIIISIVEVNPIDGNIDEAIG